MRIEKVKLHAPNTYYPAGRGYPASAGAEGTGDGRRRVSSVSYRRTGMHSDGSAEMEAGEDLLKVMHVLQLDSVPVVRDAAAASGEPGRGKGRGSGAEGPQAAGARRQTWRCRCLALNEAAAAASRTVPTRLHG